MLDLLIGMMLSMLYFVKQKICRRYVTLVIQRRLSRRKPLIQNDVDKNELHDFNDITPRSLRDYNRGAVLANIHDKYVVEGKIHPKAMEAWLKELHAYLCRIPEGEIESAKDSMKLHLQKRDVIYG